MRSWSGNNELERKWKEAVVAYVYTQFRRVMGQREGNHQRLHSRTITCIRGDMNKGLYINYQLLCTDYYLFIKY